MTNDENDALLFSLSGVITFVMRPFLIVSSFVIRILSLTA